MARLARLRFVCIGHPDARIDDLTLDFRDGEGRATDSTLWLRNGGGKSSLLNLFFSVVQPYRRQFLGGKAEFGDRQLEEYIKGDDHAAVVAEWELPDQQPGLGHGVLAPARFLTGVFYEWRPGSGARWPTSSSSGAASAASGRKPRWRRSTSRRTGRRSSTASASTRTSSGTRSG